MRTRSGSGVNRALLSFARLSWRVFESLMHSKKPSMRWGLDRVSLHRLQTLNTEERVGGRHGNMMRSDIVTYPSNHACQHIITILIPLLFYNLIIGLLSFIEITGNGLCQLFCQWCQINVIITNIAFFHCLQPNQQLHDSKMNNMCKAADGCHIGIQIVVASFCHAPSQLDPGEPSHTRIHLTTDCDLTQLNALPRVGNAEYSPTRTSLGRQGWRID